MNLQSTIDIDFKRFFQWWGRELAFLIPVGIRRFLSDKPARIILTANNLGFNVSSYLDEDQVEPVFSRFFEFSEREVFETLIQQVPGLEKAEYILALNAEQAIAKIVYLPEAALENLQQVVGFELDRYTPFTAEQVYYSVAPLAKTGYGQIQVLLVLSPQAIIDELYGQISLWNLQLSRIEYADLHAEFPQLRGQYNLLPDRYRTGTDKLAESVHWLLNFLIFVLMLAVLVYPVWQDKQAVDQLKNQIKTLEKETRVVDAQQMEIDALRDQTQWLINNKVHTPEIIKVLTELTHLFKDDSWLTNLQYSEMHAQIQGQSPMASALIGVLEASPYFSNVSFVSPLTQDKTTGLERFQISMDVIANPPLPDAAVANPDNATSAEPQPESDSGKPHE